MVDSGAGAAGPNRMLQWLRGIVPDHDDALVIRALKSDCGDGVGQTSQVERDERLVAKYIGQEPKSGRGGPGRIGKGVMAKTG